MSYRTRVVFLMVCLVAFIVDATAATKIQDKNQILVSANSVKNKLLDPSLVVLHISRDRGSYDQGHIPGARLILLNQIVVARDGNDNEMSPVDQLRTVLEAAGVSNNSRIVLYDDAQGMLAARAFFTLEYLGLGRNAALLDGGLAKWIADGNSLDRNVPKPFHGRLKVAAHSELLMTYDQVRQSISRRSAILIDARPPQQYAGKHITGARNVFWMDTLTSDQTHTFKPVTVIRSTYTTAGVTQGTKIVVYCNTGMQASHAYFTLKLLGFSPVLYDGSFQD